MNIDVVIIICLLVVIVLLLTIVQKIHKKTNFENNVNIQKINQNIENLYNKTLEQTGHVNSKIDEIGFLTKKMSNAMSSNISDMGEMGDNS